MAHHYPPTPVYGQYPPAAYYPQLSQPQQQAMRPLAGGYPPNMQNPPAPAYFNPSRFDGHAQIPSPSAFPQFPPASFTPEMFRHFATSNLPPPSSSLPPLPPPNLGFAPFTQQPPHTDHFNRPQNIAAFDGTQQSIMWRAPAEQAENKIKIDQNQEQELEPYRHPAELAENASEDGELSDGEVDGDADASANQSSRTISHEDAAMLSGRSPNAQRPTQPDLSMGNAVRLQTQIEPESVLSDSGESVSSYNPPSASTPGSDHNPLENAQTPVSATANQIPALARSLSASYQRGKPASHMRELAKGALLSLAPHKIMLSELLSEGIDGRILHELYAELGIKDITNGSSSKAQDASLLHIGNLTGIERFSSPTETPSQKMPLNTSKPPTSVNKALGEENPALVQPQPVGTAATSDQNSTAQPVVKSVSQTQVAISPIMERKDRIAQLLAARTGKLGSNRNTPETPSPVLTTKATPAPHTASPEPAKPPVVPTPAKITPTSESLRASIQNKKNSRNKAQTELVRQKMESLKKEALTKSQSSIQPQQTSTSLPVPSVFADVDAANIQASDDIELPSSEFLEVGRKLINLPDPGELRSKDLTNSHSNAFQSVPFLIPGLFMTSADLQRPEVPQPASAGAVFGTLQKEAVRANRQTSESRSTSNADVAQLKPVYLSAIPSPSTDNTTEVQRPQKRQLAADTFDEIVEPPAKRPVGRSEVLNAPNNDAVGFSDEDASEGEIMEIDNESQGSIPSRPTMSLPQPATAQDLTDLALSSRQPPESFDATTRSSPSRATSVTPNTATERASGSLWLAKSQEIEAMRRKIAEAEERQKLKKSQSQIQSAKSSGQNTPLIAQAISTSSLLGSPTTTQQPSPQETFAAKAAALKAEVLRQRLLRRKTLQDGLPDLDDEVLKTRSRLAETQAKLTQLREEAARREAEREAERRAALQREQDILAEAMRLEEQLQQGLSGRKLYSEELHHLDSNAETGLTTNGTDVKELEQSVDMDSLDHPQSSPEDLILEHTHVEPEATGQQSAQDIEGFDSHVSAIKELPVAHEKEKDTEFERLSPNIFTQPPTYEAPLHENLMQTKSVTEATTDLPESPHRLAPHSDQEVIEIVSSSSQEGEPLPSDFTSEHQSMEESLSIGEGQSPMDLDNESDGSASMSDSASDEHELEGPGDHQGYSVEDDSDEYDPEEAPVPIPAPMPPTEGDLDEYEPAETLNFTEAAIGLANQSNNNQQGISVSGTSTYVDGREDGLQLTEADTLTKSQGMPQLVDDAVNSKVSVVPSEPITRFVPYQSPLASLRSFRFNPTYSEKVKEGYRSLTYSHAIDPKRPLCPTELYGEKCKDSTCEEQHFRNMVVPDANILQQLASAHDITDKAQRDRFLAGVKQVIADLRVRKVKEFSEVADELAAYRRRFRKEQNPALLAPAS